VYAANVMTTHAHWIVRPFEGQSMLDLATSVKRYSATEVNRIRNRKGHLWRPESFDHIVRDVESFDWFVRYVVNNPIEAGVVARPSEYRWTRVHPDAGWEPAAARIRREADVAHASERRATTAEDIKILFLPDQHLGRNTAAAYGVDVATQTVVYDPKKTARGEDLGGASVEQLRDARVILWAGHCSVHKLFRPEHCDEIRAKFPGMKILVHPECCKEVVDKADLNGSTEFIIKTLRDAEPGSKWAVGTEVHLVTRLARECKERGVEVRILSDCQCLCTTMYRIDQPHLLWVLDNLVGEVEGKGGKKGKPKVVNAIRVHPEVRKDAVLALERMLKLTGVKSLAHAD
jgi:quinolinate synthetase A subunit